MHARSAVFQHALDVIRPGRGGDFFFNSLTEKFRDGNATTPVRLCLRRGEEAMDVLSTAERQTGRHC